MKKIFDPKMLSALLAADSFVVCAHERPDGDAVGSLLAMGRLLKALGKRVTLVSKDDIPDKYLQFFEDAREVVKPEAITDSRFDVAFAVDVADSRRLSCTPELFDDASVTMQIDHHAGNYRYARHNAVDFKASATGELIVQLYDELHVPIDPVAAAQLYVAISTDSGNFTFDCVRAETFAAMQRLMESGLDIADINRRLFKDRKLQQVNMLSCALKTLTLFAGGRASYMYVTQEDLRAANAGSEHLSGIVNYGLDIEGVKMTFMADEQIDGSWKISLRSVPGYCANIVAFHFGGGGHAQAAGCTINAPWEEVRDRLIAEVEEQLRE